MTEFLMQSEHTLEPAAHSLLLVVAFVVALTMSILLTRTLRGRAASLGLAQSPRHLTDAPPVAKVGGIAIGLTIGIIGPLLWAVFGERGLHPTEYGPLLAVFGGAAVMMLLGVWDDLKELRPRTKLVVQIITAAVVWIAGVRFGGFAAPGGLIRLLPIASLIVTVFWFVALTNAFNLVDGADGVAGGAALTAILAMFVVSIFLGQSMAAYILAVAAGAVIGFLFYNFPPATVYLGDAGSMALGFLLAGVGLVTSSKATTLLAVAIPVVSLGLPILDTTLAVIRRTLRGESIAMRDQGHIHHRLARLGHSPRTVALLLFAASSVLALASLLLLTPDLRLVGTTYALLGVVVFIGLQRLRMPEMLHLRRAIVERTARSPWERDNGAIRSGLKEISEATEADKYESLARLFEELTDFVQVEISAKDGGRVLWEWKRPASLLQAADCEMRSPLLAGGAPVATLRLRRPWALGTTEVPPVLVRELASALGIPDEPYVGGSFGDQYEDDPNSGSVAR